MKRSSSDYLWHLMALCFFSLMVIIPLIFTGCSTGKEAADHGEYEVIAVSSYEVITGSRNDGPVTKTYIAFIYMDSGTACLRSDYYEDELPSGNYILIGESNKYVVVQGYREIDEFLYLTQETYDSIFSEAETNE